MSSLGNGHYNQIHTAYFAVPNYYFENYGRLQKIFAEWYEYKLKKILVTSNQALYDEASKYTGSILSGNEDETIPLHLWYGKETVSSANSQNTAIEWAYNDDDSYEEWWGIDGMHVSYTRVDSNDYMIPLVFFSEVEDPYEIFEFLNYFKTAGGVDSNEVLDAIYAYSNDLGNGYVDPSDRKISKDLFYDYVDEGRVYGFQQREVDFEDTFELDSYDSNHGWWDKVFDFGIFGKPEDIDIDLTVQPIYDVKETDLNGNDEEVADRLYINERDVDTFRAYYNKYKNTHHIILFRFANTDYFSRAVGYNAPNGVYSTEEGTDSYVCSETVFLNFDIIFLTFNDDGEYRVFPVVSDPIDVVGDIESPADSELAEDLEEFGQAVKDFFDRIADWFKESWESIKIALIVIGAVIAVILLVWIITKVIGLFTGGKKTTIRIDVPKETGTVQNARKKKPAKTVSQTKRK